MMQRVILLYVNPHRRRLNVHEIIGVKYTYSNVNICKGEFRFVWCVD